VLLWSSSSAGAAAAARCSRGPAREEARRIGASLLADEGARARALPEEEAAAAEEDELEVQTRLVGMLACGRASAVPL
jgi:hypothetical protein